MPWCQTASILTYGARQDDGKYLAGIGFDGAVVGLQVQFIEPPMSVGDRAKLSPEILLFTLGPVKLAVITPLATVTEETYLPLMDAAALGRPADWLFKGK